MQIKYEPRDLWVGIFWDRAGRTTTLETDRQHYRVYVCLVPCFPVIFTISRNIPASPDARKLVSASTPNDKDEQR
jgi:hypothetical protein